ncbi:putative resuscitation-promoting factor RpfA domain protein, partial [Mycobacteroides abscessus 5S-0921]
RRSPAPAPEPAPAPAAAPEIPLPAGVPDAADIGFAAGKAAFDAGPVASNGIPTSPEAVAGVVRHLPDPNNLPPGTTDVAPGDSRGVSYLKDIVFAMQTQDVKASDAILALAQR